MTFNEQKFVERLREVEREQDLLRDRIDQALLEPKALRERLDNAKDKIQVLEREVTTLLEANKTLALRVEELLAENDPAEQTRVNNELADDILRRVINQLTNNRRSRG